MNVVEAVGPSGPSAHRPPPSPRAVFDLRPWPPLPQTGDGLGRDIQRKTDVLLGQSLAHGIALVVVPAAGEREQLRFKISEP